MPSDIRHVGLGLWVTRVIVLGLCGGAALQGWNIIEFVRARAAVAADRDLRPALRPWMDIAGVAVTAREDMLAATPSPVDPGDAQNCADELLGVLSVHPLSSLDWLSLAGMRLLAGRAKTEIANALSLSGLTGPNEGSVMLQRGLFGVLRWEILRRDLQQRVISDLSGMLLTGSVSDRQVGMIRTILLTKPAPVLQEIASLLRRDRLVGH